MEATPEHRRMLGGVDFSNPAAAAAYGRSLRREPIWVPGASTKRVDHDQRAIGRLIEHRSPFLLIDRITAVDWEHGAIEGTRRIDPNDPILAGHFPGDPVYPGALQIEMVGQLALCTHHFQAGRTSDIPAEVKPQRFRGVQVHYAAFLAPLRPGDEPTVRARLLASDSLAMTCGGQLFLDGKILAATVMEAYFVD
jgi:3-hydroxymyristoyl/3-hydroxydecanoyl-(acyl carrier protein) dehydratase